MKIGYTPRFAAYEKKNYAAALVRRGLLAWLTAAAVEFLCLPAPLRDLSGLEGLAQMSAGRMILVAGISFCLLWGLSVFQNSEKLERWAFAAVFVLMAGSALVASFSWGFLAACTGVAVVFLIFALRGWDLSESHHPQPAKGRKIFAWLTAGAALAFFLLVSVWTVCRVYSFSTPTFDFTIFAQMFHSMKTTGLPITTVERDGPLSHFAVHVSPIYYLMLPVYWLVPRPETLQVLQAAVIASAVLPLWKLGKRHGLGPGFRFLLCLLLLLYPACAGGTSYDIHENAFLTPLILWLFYGIDRRNAPLTAIFAVLTCMVKEDAPVYVAVVGLWLLVTALVRPGRKWELIAGSGLIMGAVGYFLAVTGYLAQSGDGVMTYRYKNFMYDGSDSLVTVIKAVLLNPMKAVYECMDPEKLSFIGLTLLALLGIPLMTRRYERYILLIPYVLINLMSDYQYQHDIFFQYTYGSTAFLLYLTLVNLADFRGDRQRLAVLGAAVCVSACCFGSQIMPKALRYPSYCVTYEEHYAKLRETLSVIPEDASAAATTFYTTALSQRETLYDVRYASQEHLLSCEYVALGVTDTNSYKAYAVDGESGFENLVVLLEAEGYELIKEYQERLVVYRRTE